MVATSLLPIRTFGFCLPIITRLSSAVCCGSYIHHVAAYWHFHCQISRIHHFYVLLYWMNLKVKTIVILDAFTINALSVLQVDVDHLAELNS